MARSTHTLFTLKGTLVCCTPVHVGGFGDDPDTDLPLARDGQGRCYIPGTSLAGALRQWCYIRFAEADVEAVWGIQKKNKTGQEEGHASYFTVDDLHVSDRQLIPEVRDGVGIDRQTGAAAEHIKYDRAILPRGTKLQGFTITAEVDASCSWQALGMLLGLQNALKDGHIRLGAAKTRGLGKVCLETPALKQVHTNTPLGILKLLEGKDDDIPETELADAPKPKESPRLEIKIDWQPDGPLMVKAEFEGIAADMLPLVSGVADRVAPVLPGSSVKGVLRSRAEQIICTLLGILPAPTDTNVRKKFLDDTSVPLVDELFGARNRSDESIDPWDKKRGRYLHGRSSDDEQRLGLGALCVDDCYATTSIAREKWEQVVTAGERILSNQILTAEQSLRSATEAAEVGHWQQAFHVAIDRWTGGAAESFLYTVLEPHSVVWEPLELSIDLARLPRTVRNVGITLLILVLRDLFAGRLSFGFGVNRGMGAVRINRITITPYAAGDLWGSSPLILAGPDLVGLPNSVRSTLTWEWQQWLDRKPIPETSR
jgi:CRISPR/Cas system CSM-associated protein Csm3 (group 7 of RAMP superfamily)